MRVGRNLIVEAPTEYEHVEGPYLLRDLLGVTLRGQSEAQRHYLEPRTGILRRDGLSTDPILVAGAADRVGSDGAEQVGGPIHEFAPHDLAQLVFLTNPPQRDGADEPGGTLHRYDKDRVVFVAAQLSRRSARDMTDPWAGTLD